MERSYSQERSIADPGFPSPHVAGQTLTVRQLAYNFRPWRALEATGRAGGDEGYDARGFEITDTADIPVIENDGDDETPAQVSDDRLWLVQSKREKTITPAKLKKVSGGYPGHIA
jgi:hypothetical protein